MNNYFSNGQLGLPGQIYIRDFFQGPSIVGPPSHKPPTSFPYFKGFLWEWYGRSMGMGVPLLRVPGIFVDYIYPGDPTPNKVAGL